MAGRAAEMRVWLTYQHTLVQEFSVGLDAEWLADALGLSIDELLALDGAELDARLETIHYAIVTTTTSTRTATS
jgi:hypothetical protein